ncbi:tetratricopeptide repeat protein [Shewanella sp. WXL01]|uniref:Tetratricopeptide repeat protein n=1 Tax=Shewanella maritima TaxID=2520507 RepID=A0A411PKY2_9GAMM|nr:MULTISPECIES: tetratricopeptide repeat protein [Shewanella]NKF51768.1 tetratricopeptide repeat protein [Shewanella sp. WXL01]QBF84174.1 tetratricopeptide repeat protein [Shewanella maritima]
MGVESSDLSALVEAVESLSKWMTYITIFLCWTYFSVVFAMLKKSFFGKDCVPAELEDADVLVEQAEYEKLFRNCRRLLKKRPNNAEAHWYIGLCYYHKSRYEKAKEYFLKTIKLNPHWQQSVDVYLDYIESAKNEMAESKESLEKFII